MEICHVNLSALSKRDWEENFSIGKKRKISNSIYKRQKQKRRENLNEIFSCFVVARM
jgi:hypothetical protein